MPTVTVSSEGDFIITVERAELATLDVEGAVLAKLGEIRARCAVEDAEVVRAVLEQRVAGVDPGDPLLGVLNREILRLDRTLEANRGALARASTLAATTAPRGRGRTV